MEAVLRILRSGILGRPGLGVRGVTAYAIIGLFMGVLAGCGSTNPARWSSTASPASPAGNDARDVELRAQEQRWHGTPYRWGGLTREGVDCSGFVMTVYQDLFDVSLPRTTAEQVQVGQAVARGELQAGDLIFFHPPGKAHHVGLYLSAGEFAHASTSEGVTISHLDDTYWHEAYWTTRRVLPPTGSLQTASSTLKKERLSKRRVGW